MRKVKLSEEEWRGDIPASEESTEEPEYHLFVTGSEGCRSSEKRSGTKVDVEGNLSNVGVP
uniref:Uncharacterized protein n=1 Tax=Trichinella nativa TaxID=6335 RepID=A0A0V1KIP9_9BILA